MIALALAGAIAVWGAAASFGTPVKSVASPFDGKWTATLTGTATGSDAGITGASAKPCCTSFAFTVSGGIISSPAGSAGDLISGTLASTGTVNITLHTVALESDPSFGNPVFFAHPCTFVAKFKSAGTAASVGTVVCAAPGAGGFGGSFRGVFNAVRGTAGKSSVLIAGLGDSVAAGEGIPPFNDTRCHRSVNSYQSFVAKDVTQAHPGTQVTFIPLACSGASIYRGVDGSYRGLYPPRGAPSLYPQILELSDQVRSRRINALLLSIGANDLGFGQIVEACIKKPSCYTKPFTYDDNGIPEDFATLEAFVTEQLAMLPGLFDELATHLGVLNLDASRVFISAYFDPLYDAQGMPCSYKVPVPGYDGLSPDEASWANRAVLIPLNDVIAAAASKHGWTLVGGIPQAFTRHGVCAGSASWITGLYETYIQQGDRYGFFHPNPLGEQAIARFNYSAVAPAIARDLNR